MNTVMTIVSVFSTLKDDVNNAPSIITINKPNMYTFEKKLIAML